MVDFYLMFVAARAAPTGHGHREYKRIFYIGLEQFDKIVSHGL